jgi:hypothetical protein
MAALRGPGPVPTPSPAIEIGPTEKRGNDHLLRDDAAEAVRDDMNAVGAVRRHVPGELDAQVFGDLGGAQRIAGARRVVETDEAELGKRALPDGHRIAGHQRRPSPERRAGVTPEPVNEDHDLASATVVKNAELGPGARRRDAADETGEHGEAQIAQTTLQPHGIPRSETNLDRARMPCASPRVE